MKNLPKFLVLFLIILLSLAIIGVWQTRGEPSVDPNKYQAVFMEGGQHYFGHLKNLGTRYPYLTDVYYVKSQPQTSEDTEQQFQLIKTGNEIHGPEDVLYLNWSKVLYWQNLKADAKIVKGIEQEKTQRIEPQIIAPQNSR